LTKISKELEDDGFIIKECYCSRVKTMITLKGEKLLRVLKELKKVWGA